MCDVRCMKQRVFHDRKIPSLHLFGTWLMDADFLPGDKAQVKIYKRTLIIRQVIND